MRSNRGALRVGTVIAAVTFAVTSVVMPNVAGANGSQYPPGAPTIKIGTTIHGDLADHGSWPKQSYYRLPSLEAGDVVTVSVLSKSSDTVSFCIASDVDRFDWQTKWCNNSQTEGAGQAGKRVNLQAVRASSNSYLRLFNFCDFCNIRTPYQFTVEKIRKGVNLAVSVPWYLNRDATLTVNGTLARNGQPAPNGHPVVLSAVVDGKAYNFNGTFQGGKARIKLALPKATLQRVGRITAWSPETATYAASSTSARQAYMVEAKQVLAISFRPPNTLSRNQELTAKVTTASGGPVSRQPDGARHKVVFNLFVDGRRFDYETEVYDGVARAKISLPKSVAGKPGTVTVNSADSVLYFPSSSSARKFNVVK